MHIHFRLDPQRHVHVFFLRDRDFTISGMASAAFFPLRLVFAELQIARDGQPVPLRGRNRFQCELRRGGADRRRDARDVKPSRALERFRPIDVAFLRQRDCAVVAVGRNRAAPARRLAPSAGGGELGLTR